MKRRYRVGSPRAGGETHFSDPVRIEPALNLIKAEAQRLHAPYFIKGRKYTRLESVVSRARRELVTHRKTGSILEIKCARGTIRVRRVEVKPRKMLIWATPSVRRVHRFVLQRYLEAESWGRYSYRSIAGSSSWSQHSYKPPNAEDWHLPSTKELVEAGKAVVNQCKGDVAELIVDRKIYTPSQNWHPYSGSCPHRKHFHVSGNPLKRGTPPRP